MFLAQEEIEDLQKIADFFGCDVLFPPVNGRMYVTCRITKLVPQINRFKAFLMKLKEFDFEFIFSESKEGDKFLHIYSFRR